VAEGLNAICEADVLECSYGFRPGRNAHQALLAMHLAIMSERGNWVFDADIRGFFDSVDHGWLMRMVEHRIADPRILRLIRQWLEAGVLENGVRSETVEGTPQGAGISPILANLLLHYVLDLCVRPWQRRHATGRMRLVRHADDFVLTLERREDGERLARALGERLAKFGLQRHGERTRLIEFGHFAAEQRMRRKLRKSATLDFLGFTHYWARTRPGRYMVLRKTQQQRTVRKLKELRENLWWRMHRPVPDPHAWLCAVQRGHYGYYGITGNSRSVALFYRQVCRAWWHVLRRRSQKRRMTWAHFNQLMQVFPLPLPHIVHVWPVPGGSLK
jgi:group II intron reverse transcriptase/maturase